MNNNLVTYQEVELNGKKYMLQFDINSACELEEVLGKGIAAILNEEQIGFRLCRAFYWAGLKWKFPGLTIERVGRLLQADVQATGRNVMELMKPVMNALMKSRLLGSAPKENIDNLDDLEANGERDNTTDLESVEGDEFPNV